MRDARDLDAPGFDRCAAMRAIFYRDSGPFRIGVNVPMMRRSDDADATQEVSTVASLSDQEVDDDGSQ